MPCQRSFDPVGATGGGARAYCELESGSFRTPAGHGPAPQALQASIPGKLYDIAQKCVRYEAAPRLNKLSIASSVRPTLRKTSAVCWPTPGAILGLTFSPP